MTPDDPSEVAFEACGEVPEWSNGAVSKTVVPKGTVGSNPTLSAIYPYRPASRGSTSSPIADHREEKWKIACFVVSTMMN